VENKDNRIQELEKQVQELQEENNRLLQELEDQKDTLELE
jgi:predicted RNase H-like nuclease (RuvC/YqgF family)